MALEKSLTFEEVLKKESIRHNIGKPDANLFAGPKAGYNLFKPSSSSAPSSSNNNDDEGFETVESATPLDDKTIVKAFYNISVNFNSATSFSGIRSLVLGSMFSGPNAKQYRAQLFNELTNAFSALFEPSYPKNNDTFYRLSESFQLMIASVKGNMAFYISLINKFFEIPEEYPKEAEVFLDSLQFIFKTVSNTETINKLIETLDIDLKNERLSTDEKLTRINETQDKILKLMDKNQPPIGNFNSLLNKGKFFQKIADQCIAIDTQSDENLTNILNTFKQKRASLPPLPTLEIEDKNNLLVENTTSTSKNLGTEKIEEPKTQAKSKNTEVSSDIATPTNPAPVTTSEESSLSETLKSTPSSINSVQTDTTSAEPVQITHSAEEDKKISSLQSQEKSNEKDPENTSIGTREQFVDTTTITTGTSKENIDLAKAQDEFHEKIKIEEAPENDENENNTPPTNDSVQLPEIKTLRKVTPNIQVRDKYESTGYETSSSNDAMLTIEAPPVSVTSAPEASISDNTITHSVDNAVTSTPTDTSKNIAETSTENSANTPVDATNPSVETATIKTDIPQENPASAKEKEKLGKETPDEFHSKVTIQDESVEDEFLSTRKNENNTEITDNKISNKVTSNLQAVTSNLTPATEASAPTSTITLSANTVTPVTTDTSQSKQNNSFLIWEAMAILSLLIVSVVIGGTIGLILGGPFGALAGAIGGVALTTMVSTIILTQSDDKKSIEEDREPPTREPLDNNIITNRTKSPAKQTNPVPPLSDKSPKDLNSDKSEGVQETKPSIEGPKIGPTT